MEVGRRECSGGGVCGAAHSGTVRPEDNPAGLWWQEEAVWLWQQAPALCDPLSAGDWGNEAHPAGSQDLEVLCESARRVHSFNRIRRALAVGAGAGEKPEPDTNPTPGPALQERSLWCEETGRRTHVHTQYSRSSQKVLRCPWSANLGVPLRVSHQPRPPE